MSAVVGSQQHDPDHHHHHTTVSKHRKKPQNLLGIFKPRHYISLVTAILLAASGMVSLEDLAFAAFTLIYMYFISKFAFPTLIPSGEPPILDQNNKLLGLYFLLAMVIGLLLPIAYILEGIFDGDKDGIKGAVQHVFLLSCQSVMEGLAFSHLFSTPIRVFVPVSYNSKRIFTVVEWLRAEFSKVGGGRLCIGRGLAMANLALWCYNLFGFLLPVYLPRAFKYYYSGYKAKD
ncbi:hypothetical protein Acr_03g0009550 [Actinidia rufa]|uniref:DUF7733 domain-containing protein n=1 Tax=Actinidia rufa TaxID=165716 RepID=A0A7J0ECH8_9ERIC|nr:hypothetical protein Acr_03g0009550 [Actinidia rufa]